MLAKHPEMYPLHVHGQAWTVLGRRMRKDIMFIVLCITAHTPQLHPSPRACIIRPVPLLPIKGGSSLDMVWLSRQATPYMHLCQPHWHCLVCMQP